MLSLKLEGLGGRGVRRIAFVATLGSTLVLRLFLLDPSIMIMISGHVTTCLSMVRTPFHVFTSIRVFDLVTNFVCTPGPFLLLLRTSSLCKVDLLLDDFFLLRNLSLERFHVEVSATTWGSVVSSVFPQVPSVTKVL